MNKRQVTRREFIKLGLISLGGLTLASCAPAGPTTSTPKPAPTPQPTVMILNPRKNTKVTNPNVIFKWESVPSVWGYALEVFILKLGTDNSKYSWDLAFNDIVQENSYDANAKKHNLERGGYYYWQVTPLKNEISSLPPINQYKLPSGISGNIDKDETQQDPPTYPTRDSLPYQIGSDSGRFFLKPEKNYLEKYLKIKGKGQRPIIPLVFCLFDRYSKIKSGQNIPITPLDKIFDTAINGLDDVPLELRDRIGGESSLLTPDRLQNFIAYYNDADSFTKINLFGDKFNNIPTDEKAVENWINDAVDALFEGSLIQKICQVKKTIDIEIGKVIIGTAPLNGPLHLFVDDSLILNGTIKEKEIYKLRISVDSGESISVENMRCVKETNGQFFLNAESSNLNGLDSINFKAQLILPNGEQMDGFAEVKGGIPILLSVEPGSPIEGATNIKLKVRDGGSGTTIILWQFDSQTQAYGPISISRVPEDQTLYNQTYKFDIAGGDFHVSPGSYNISYQNSKDNSINELAFYVQGLNYTVQITELKCIDESNPEWWGDDSISFSTLINTKQFVQKPTDSRVYDGFHDGHPQTSFVHNDNLLYYRNDPNAQDASIQGRIIEDHLSISIAIYEHDDLAWLAWVINKVIDAVQSFIEGLINVYSFGVGGYIIEAGLEASGLNDMREQAINSLVAGWEVELLHEGTATTIVENGALKLLPLDMNGDESEYKVTFNLVSSQP